MFFFLPFRKKDKINFSQPSDRSSVYHIIRSIFVIISLQIIYILRDFFPSFSFVCYRPFYLFYFLIVGILLSLDTLKKNFDGSRGLVTMYATIYWYMLLCMYVSLSKMIFWKRILVEVGVVRRVGKDQCWEPYSTCKHFYAHNITIESHSCVMAFIVVYTFEGNITDIAGGVWI